MKMRQIKALILISCLLVILNCKTTPPLRFQENKQDQRFLTVVGSNSSTINTENVDINEEQTSYINMNEKTFINLLNTNFDKLSLIEGIWSNEKNTYKIGIQKAKGKGKYFAFILNSQEPTMKKGEIIAEFVETRYEYIYFTEYYLEDKTKIVTKSIIDAHGMLLIFKKKGGEIEAFFRNFPIKEATEAKEKVKESLKEITKPRKELVLLKEKDDKKILQARSDKKIDNTIKFINKLKVDSQYAYKTFYTIQSGSYTKKADAEEKYNSILQALNKKEHDYLRIEKIGIFYAVRLGKFDNYDNVLKFHKVIRPQLSTSVIMKAYIKKERIIKLYEYNEPTFNHEVQQKKKRLLLEF